MKLLFNNPKLKVKRKSLRNNSTSAEAVLWTFLKASKLEGRKFRRQASIGNFIVDFYCPSEKLVLELDGDAHFKNEQTIQRDLDSKVYFSSLGIKVIHIENKFVFTNIEMVLDAIRDQFNNN